MRDDLTSGNGQETHESYGILSLSRVSCSQGQNLFGSSVRPHNIVTLKISTAKRQREFQKDWIHDDKTLIEVEMSPAQFAEAITTMNVGCGTPVTLKYVTGDKSNHRSGCPDENFRRVMQTELKEEMAILGKKLAKLTATTKELLKGSGALKKADREQILNDIDQLEMEVNSNIPFVHECFNEAIDKTMTAAKSELDAVVSHVKMSLGEKAIAELKYGNGGIAVDVPMIEGKAEDLP